MMFFINKNIILNKLILKMTISSKILSAQTLLTMLLLGVQVHSIPRHLQENVQKQPPVISSGLVLNKNTFNLPG